jgi:hypothetical protein
MRKGIAMALRRLADKIDKRGLLEVLGSIEYVATHRGMTGTEMREFLGSALFTTRGRGE